MISSVAQLLRELQEAEAKELAAIGIKHPGTIGDMYEGLTSELLRLSIPEEFAVQVVNGFARGHDGTLSPQMDIMVVYGEGESIPYTNAFSWPIERVLAVFEVKKTLYGSHLADGLKKMAAVFKMDLDNRNAGDGTDASLKFAAQSFARSTGYFPLTDAAAAALPDDLGLLFDLFKHEQLAPVRVIFGYEGYVDASGLGDGLIEQAQEVDVLRFPERMPTLVVCRNSAVVKLNGQPYVSRLDGDRFFRLLACNSENPIRLLLEQLWTKLVTTFQLTVEMDDTLQMETLAPLLSCRFSLDAATATRRLEYRQDVGMSESLDAEPRSRSWEPTGSNEDEFVVLNIAAAKGKLDLQDQGFHRYAQEEGFDARALCEQLVEKRMLAWTSETTLRLISDTLLTSIAGRGGITTTDNPELLSLWLKSQIGGNA